MNDKQAAKEKMQVLKELREKHADSVAKTQAQLKEYQTTRRLLKKAMKAGPMTVPEIAEVVDLPSDEVLWHIVAMKKYDLVNEVGRSGDYFQYELAGKKEARK